jgi:hypothetical protein
MIPAALANFLATKPEFNKAQIAMAHFLYLNDDTFREMLRNRYSKIEKQSGITKLIEENTGIKKETISSYQDFIKYV